jgi:hypothetical protein
MTPDPHTTTAPAVTRQYALSAILGGATSAYPFRRSLTGVAVGPDDAIHALGDGDVRVFAASGEFVRRWPAPPGAACLTVGRDGRVFAGSLGRVDIYDASGRHDASFDAGEAGKPAAITSIKTFHQEILVGDAAARVIVRYGATGVRLGEVGNRDKTRGFMLPNRSLDFDVDARGVIHATDTGRHRVASWALDGSFLGAFGAFGQARPEDFVGCCNPVNLALAPDGTVVTGEKMVARVKVYESGGGLLAVIGPAHFDQSVTHLHLAVDAKGRILAADPVRREIKIFTRVPAPAGPGR